ncbi:MAG TPA: TIR domain-containing protein [Thermoanaerobaculia bacterium]|jgi:hypothetical protein|nr:TIR domain-containing protein [Thermoanaerobaculia bacterium]
MARRVFFSFHYERDIWRAGQIRNCWVGRDREQSGFWDAASWESIKRQGEEAVRRWINQQLNGTSVTAVLIGAETASRPYVRYEIQRSYEVGNGLLGIYIHNIRDQHQRTDVQGVNPFSQIFVEQGGQRLSLAQTIPTYDWVNDRGYQNCGSWIEAAATKAGR